MIINIISLILIVIILFIVIYQYKEGFRNSTNSRFAPAYLVKRWFKK
jgi:hypothetical protein